MWRHHTAVDGTKAKAPKERQYIIGRAARVLNQAELLVGKKLKYDAC